MLGGVDEKATQGKKNHLQTGAEDRAGRGEVTGVACVG